MDPDIVFQHTDHKHLVSRNRPGSIGGRYCNLDQLHKLEDLGWGKEQGRERG
eukprot:CAMPEP_0201489226 /NCGR_PEP_ID=MMETSP0151_2-20130828/21388_1 /ASSEMBLY_ACC=CAM_ASM_000257 /TAXON_ID=200890 /ORGANISM="Paramoeba atlantica, Strain 621/1 / CCAP 1560/9" /LENGTH=51 /DNA_ID=CAMNT_0047874745 /DNA_START=504 /DNA_END=655 /DNA_ORIENTATION=+